MDTRDSGLFKSANYGTFATMLLLPYPGTRVSIIADPGFFSFDVVCTGTYPASNTNGQRKKLLKGVSPNGGTFYFSLKLTIIPFHWKKEIPPELIIITTSTIYYLGVHTA